MRLALVYLIILFPDTLFAQRADTSFYSVVANGFISGAQKSWKENKNEHHYIYYTMTQAGERTLKKKL
jgi:hypothetical protein